MPTLQVQGCHRIPADVAATFERAGQLVLLEAPKPRDHSASFFLAPRIGRSKLGASIVRFNQKGLLNFMGNGCGDKGHYTVRESTARYLGLSTATLSQTVRALETRFGARLLRFARGRQCLGAFFGSIIVIEARAKLNKEALAGISFGPVGKPTTVCHTSLVALWAVHNMPTWMLPAIERR